MKSKPAIFTALITASIIVGCTTAPKQSPHVTALLNDMNEVQAAKELHKLLPPRNHHGNLTRTFITGHIGLGLCKANQFSLDDQMPLDLQVSTEAISFNAVRMEAPARSTPQGIMPGVSGAAAPLRYNRIPYREQLRFDNIKSATVTETRLLRTVCGRQKGQTEVIIHEAARWYAALIPTDEKDRFIAALMRLSPHAAIATELKDD